MSSISARQLGSATYILRVFERKQLVNRVNQGKLLSDCRVGRRISKHDKYLTNIEVVRLKVNKLKIRGKQVTYISKTHKIFETI